MKEITLENVLRVLNDIIKEIEITEECMDADLTELGLDSILFIKTIVALEEEFDVEVPDSKLLIAEMNTAQKIWDVLKELAPEWDK